MNFIKKIAICGTLLASSNTYAATLGPGQAITDDLVVSASSLANIKLNMLKNIGSGYYVGNTPVGAGAIMGANGQVYLTCASMQNSNCGSGADGLSFVVQNKTGQQAKLIVPSVNRLPDSLWNTSGSGSVDGTPIITATPVIDPTNGPAQSIPFSVVLDGNQILQAGTYSVTLTGGVYSN